MTGVYMTDIKLVIFDLDGTLVDAYKAISASFNYTMTELGYSGQKPDTIRRAVGWGDKNLLKDFIAEKDLEQALTVYREHHAISVAKHVKMLPENRQLIERLKDKEKKLAIATNRPSRFTEIILTSLGIRHLFYLVLCADMVGAGKPSPEILDRTIRYFNFSAKETLYVGDMVIDCVTGRRAGVKTVIVLGGSSPAEEIKREEPFRVISCLSEITKVLEEL